MKGIKKILALALAMVMAFGLTATNVFADAEDPTTATISTNTEGHTYKVFQIFTGDPEVNDATNSATLTNLKYGANTKGTGRTVGNAVSQTDIEALKSISATAVNVDDVADLAAMNDFVEIDDTKAFKTVTIDSSQEVPTGYYLIKDLDDSQDTHDASYTLYLMAVLKNGETYVITPKGDKPSVEKKVKDINDSEGTTTGWQDSADYDIGDEIPYKLTGTLPSNFANYATYKTYTFTDTFIRGLTMSNAQVEDVTVTIDEDGTSIKDNFNVTFTNNILTVSLKEGVDLKKVTGLDATKKIVVKYNATLTKDATIGKEGNPNKVDLTYSNNPNVGGDGDFGKTPEDKVIVFTYKAVVDKIDKDGNALTGAGFTLYKVPAGITMPASGTNVEKNAAIAIMPGVNVVKTIEATATNSQFSFEGLDDGTYVLCETTTPTGYNTMEPLKFVINATHSVEAAEPVLLTLSATEPFTANNLESATVSKTNKSSHNRVSGEAYAEIVNNSGAELPETGGIGTTIFYAIGSVLVVGAGILLISKKRMFN